ncbi:aldehyde dehydrogenase family protein [Rathayibacter sp. CAU 1779]
MSSTTQVKPGHPHLDDAAAYIDGTFRELSDRIDVVEKATGAHLGSAGLGGRGDLDEAIAAAVRAQEEWSHQPYDVRAALVRSVAARLEDRLDQVTDLIVRETGSIPGKAEYEVHGAIDELHVAAGLASLPRGDLLVSHDPGRFGFSERLPVGVVAAITPWNFPLILAMRVIAPAIALGNAVVLKPSPETPLSGGFAIAEAFDAAGAPAGLFQVICGDTEFSEALVAHPDVDMVHFTGSTAVGSRIAATAGGLLKRVSLELGGNNALLVLDDADPDYASMLGAWSTFHYQGQTCISASRHIVAEAVAEEYIRHLADRASAITVGDPSKGSGIGPMINERQAARAEGILRKSVEMGARIVTGGTRDGLFFRPTVVTDITPDMPVWTEEVFAPIAPVMTVTDDAQAIRVANDTPYGLVDAVVTRDEGRGRRVARELKAGMVHVNDATPVDEAVAPFGGTGASGLGGRSGGLSNIEEFTGIKWTAVQENTLSYPY